MSDQKSARNKLLEGGYSCVLVRDGNIIMASCDRGIKPVFSKLAEDKNFLKGASMADKIVGRALALLSLFAGIKSVYGYVMSDCAKIILGRNGVGVECTETVPYIMNRDRTGKCLMEELVEDTEDPETAFDVISNFFRERPS